MSTTKSLLYTLIVIANLLGLFLVGIGICQYVYNTENWGFYASIFYIGIGVVPLGLCLLVCITNRCCQILYVIFLWICMAVQLAIAYFLISEQNTIALNFANIIDEAWDDELQDHGFMEGYEELFKCCGRTSPQDYVLIERTPPDVCFKDSIQKPENLILVGCRTQVEYFFNIVLIISNIIMCSMFCVEIFAICCFCCLYVHERSRWRHRY